MLETGSERQRGNAAEAFLTTLKANGVDTIFGLPGSTEAPLLEALRADDSIRYVLTLQESATVAMADGYARASERVGFVGLHTSVGTMNGLSQMYNAQRDGSPIVVTAGHKDVRVLADDGFCALPELAALPRSFTKWSAQSLDAASVPHDVRRAIHVAMTPPHGVTYLSMPEDFLAGAAAVPDQTRAFAVRAGTGLSHRPDAGAVDAAALLMQRARRPVLVLGSAAAGSAAAARALADALELPVFAADRTQMSVLPYPVRDDRYLGMYGDEWALLEDADLVIAVGGRLFYPFTDDSRPKLPPHANVIHAHADPEQVGWTRSPDVGLSGTAGAVLADLHAAVTHLGGISADIRAERIGRMSELRRRRGVAQQRDRERADAAAAGTDLTSLAALSDALGEALPDDALVFDEAISSSRLLLRLTPFGDASRVFRTTGGSLGWGVPAAVGAKIARPDRRVIALVGDGSFHFTPQALWTAVQQKAPIVAVIVDNSGYLAVKRAIERHVGVDGDRRTHPGTMLGAIDHVAVARGYGADGVVAETAAQARDAILAAFAAERTTVVVVRVPEAR